MCITKDGNLTGKVILEFCIWEKLCKLNMTDLVLDDLKGHTHYGTGLQQYREV